MSALHICAALFAATSLWVLPAAADETKPAYTLAVVPQLPPLAAHRAWAPFARRLSEGTGTEIRLKIYQTLSEFENDLFKGIPDFAFMSPCDQVRAAGAVGYVPLVRDGGEPLKGILVVRKDSPVNTVRDLDGMELAFPAPNSCAASLYMRSLLAEKEKIRFAPRYAVSHTNAYRNVILGMTRAGSGANKTLERDTPEVRAELRVLYETPGMVTHPLSAHPRVSLNLRQTIVENILRMADDEAGRRILKEIQMPRPVKTDYARDYKPLERLGLDRYVVR
ncbi:MAG: phosphate/phosphite/phosphonate ABC transporter substrate-binding protein [Nitrospirae bacterium]|nr:phosphate/phosphite/phosphonate ABC transporter substrate-binding protein [Nitrospirota bacterium]MBI3392065.1 phosphate/phosphite/phosphonate ABC transporter substrate-binding protein [Nitrospirota bacterium]